MAVHIFCVHIFCRHLAWLKHFIIWTQYCTGWLVYLQVSVCLLCIVICLCNGSIMRWLVCIWNGLIHLNRKLKLCPLYANEKTSMPMLSKEIQFIWSTEQLWMLSCMGYKQHRSICTVYLLTKTLTLHKIVMGCISSAICFKNKSAYVFHHGMDIYPWYLATHFTESNTSLSLHQ